MSREEKIQQVLTLRKMFHDKVEEALNNNQLIELQDDGELMPFPLVEAEDDGQIMQFPLVEVEDDGALLPFCFVEAEAESEAKDSEDSNEELPAFKIPQGIAKKPKAFTTDDNIRHALMLSRFASQASKQRKFH